MTLINTPLRTKKLEYYSQESTSQPGAYVINLSSALLTAKLHRHITLAILSEYDLSARHEEPKRKMFGASGGGNVGQLQSGGAQHSAFNFS